MRKYVARRLTLEIEQQPGPIDQIVALAAGTDDAALARDIVLGMAEALKGWRKAPQPDGWAALSQKLAGNALAETHDAVQELNIVFGDGRAIDELKAVVLNAAAEPDVRRQALRALLAGKPADLPPVLHGLLADRALCTEVLGGLAQYDHPDTPRKILERAGSFSRDGRSAMISTLALRPAYAKALLAVLGEKKIAPSEVSAFHARQILSFEDPELTAQLREVWGDVRASGAEKRVLIERYKSELGSVAENRAGGGGALTGANPSAGRATFQKTCANCHVLFGQGRNVGPDLTGSNRKNIDYLLENIIDPSASVGADFRVLLVTLEDGRVLSGVVSQQNDRTLTLQTPQEAVTIDRQEIETSKQSESSLMPDGLLQNLTQQQMRDLIAYLMSNDQVPLAEE